MDDARLFYPATGRNREPILDVLREVVPSGGCVLELASGSGEHAVYFAARLEGVRWIASDTEPKARASIVAWAQHEGLDNIEVCDVDAEMHPWSVQAPVDVVLCVNMIHIAPWSACQGLMAGAGEVLSPGGALVTYGPYMRGGRHTAASNASFDASLRGRNPAWGVRDVDEVQAEAEECGMLLERIVEMPANNLSLIFRRQ